MQLIREYELLLTAYDESQQSRYSEAVMSEMDSRRLGNRKSSQDGSVQAWSDNLSLKVGQLSEPSMPSAAGTGSLR